MKNHAYDDYEAKQNALYASGEAVPSFTAQHDAARWERVVRRWNHKHGGAYFWFGHPMMIAMQPMLPWKPEDS